MAFQQILVHVGEEEAAKKQVIDFESDDNKSVGYFRNLAEERKSTNESRLLVKEPVQAMEDLDKKYADRELPKKKSVSKKPSKKKKVVPEKTDTERQANMLKMIEEAR